MVDWQVGLSFWLFQFYCHDCLLLIVISKTNIPGIQRKRWSLKVHLSGITMLIIERVWDVCQTKVSRLQGNSVTHVSDSLIALIAFIRITYCGLLPVDGSGCLIAANSCWSESTKDTHEYSWAIAYRCTASCISVIKELISNCQKNMHCKDINGSLSLLWSLWMETVETWSGCCNGE